jgi:hypothetical protein
MGLLKKLADRAAAKAPDFAGEIGKCLPEGEQVIAVGQGMPEAYGGEVGGKRITGYAINKVAQKLSENKHVAGGADSCAQAIPRDLQGMHYVTITNLNVSFWDFGMAGDQIPPRLVVSFPRSSVAGIVPTGKESHGMRQTRISFVDESFVDFKIYDLGGFADGAAALSG